MWMTKISKTRDKFGKWVKAHSHKYQWQEIFVNNAYGVEYRKPRKVY